MTLSASLVAAFFVVQLPFGTRHHTPHTGRANQIAQER